MKLSISQKLVSLSSLGLLMAAFTTVVLWRR